MRVSFTYEPSDPDPSHAVGMGEAEYVRLMDAIGRVGGYDIEIEEDE